MGDVDTEAMPLIVQCKKGKRPPVWKALDEAEEAAERRTVEGKDYIFAIAAVHRDAKPGQAADRAIVMRPETFAAFMGWADEGW
jgi:hypothetical protein